ncbi:hypothetical protein DDZ18_03830 [Marinicauda salina]|uniref:Sulfotransferase family protein n=1 Tax=Marinicauda salina TaxID=2135793 RepID=A0A2U2BXJ5_9PROT|nr:sulfotransferase family 2 domain-containing protein [Marinicauda salina]PWE18732.1 hypothetical protein DDZ18_03830 [Marinicauda salina]
MPVFEKNGRRLLYIHIPKTGGTTVEETLLANGHRMSYRRGGRYGPLTLEDRERGCSPQHMHAALLEETFDPENFDEIFALVRHPVDRFVSQYKFLLAAGRKVPDFHTWMEGVPERLRRDPFVYDNHLRPQHEFIWTSRCRVFRLEEGLDAVFAALSEPGEKISYGGEAWIRLAHDDASAWRESARDHVKSLYFDDFVSFGYD